MNIGILGTGIVGQTLSLKLVQLGHSVKLRVVKTLNTMTAALMVNPKLVGNGDHTVFLSGNDAVAKAQVSELLREFGWHDILDLGEISTARGTEMMLALGHAVMNALNPVEIAFKVVR